jgi:DNA-binding LytR/AlgR family response regulator
MQLKCIIIEDEKLAQDVLKKYIELIPTLELSSCCNSSSEAITYLHSNTVDLIFLDINMPDLNGIDFLKTLQNPPLIIITTAYSEFAIDGYEFAVCDFLLKPIRYERFLRAINNAFERYKRPIQNKETIVSEIDHLFVKNDDGIKTIYFEDIIYVQALGNYLKIFCNNSKTVITRITLTEFESQLPSSNFLRVHKSYLVAIQLIEKIQLNQIYLSDFIIPIGTTYKQEVLKHVISKKTKIF